MRWSECLALLALLGGGCAEFESAPVAKSAVETPPLTPVEPVQDQAPAIPVAEPVPQPQPTLPRSVVAATPAPQPARKPGRPVASVGDDVITLPELTEAVKARLGQLGQGQAPTRRQMISVTRSVLKSMIIESLVFQEAKGRPDGQATFDEGMTRFARSWTDREFPALLKRENVTSEADLRAKLATKLDSPESLRDDFLVRSIAAELVLRDRSQLDFDGFLNQIRRRRRITSIMSPAELALAGKQAATSPDGSN